jgi:PST family polysaccharide transporter
MTALRERPPAALGRRALHGLIWMLAQNIVGRAAGLVSQFGLAILLTPADFGVIGLTYTVTTVAATLTNIGIEDVLIRRRGALHLWAGPAFWIGVGLALVVGALVAVVSPLAADMYKTPALVGLLVISAISIPIGALSSIPGMILRARMKFGVIALYGTVETVVQAALTLGFAWAGFGAYSFVLPVPILAAAKAVIWWRLAPAKISLRPQWARWRYLVGNTSLTLITRILVTIIGQGDYFVLGLTSTQQVVGAYYFGFRLAAQPLGMLAGNLSGVLYPALVQFKSDPLRQGQVALTSAKLLFFGIMPIALLQAAAAAPLVSAFFGQKWAASIPIIQILSVALALDSVSWIAGTLMNARGEFKIALKYVIIETPSFFLVVVVGAQMDQAVGVAWAVCAYYATKPVFAYLAFRKIGITSGQFASIYIRPALFSIVAVGAGWAVSKAPIFDARPLAQIFVIASLGLALYAAFLKRFAPEIWNELRARALGGLRRGAAA